MRRRIATIALAAVTATGAAGHGAPAVADAAVADVAGDPRSTVVALHAAAALIRYDRFVMAPSSFSMLLFTEYRNRAAAAAANELGLDPLALAAARAESGQRTR